MVFPTVEPPGSSDFGLGQFEKASYNQFNKEKTELFVKLCFIEADSQANPEKGKKIEEDFGSQLGDDVAAQVILKRVSALDLPIKFTNVALTGLACFCD